MNPQQETSRRKSDHIDLAFASQVTENDPRFYYEPVLAGHPVNPLDSVAVANRVMHAPIWISSMTGGTEKAGEINRILATACGKFGLGMGLGSCRIILEDDTYLPDFQLRKWIGDAHPLYANLGIAQVEELLDSNRLHLIRELIDRTQTDGLIIHINPLQEWTQPEGDTYSAAPLQTLERLLDKTDLNIIVKEVGQGMGPESLRELLALPLAGVDFGAFGGTNFTKLESDRNGNEKEEHQPLVFVGHNAEEMGNYVNQIVREGPSPSCPLVIVSGGIRNFLDGYYHIRRIKMPAIYAQASAMLREALKGQESLNQYIEREIEGLRIAEQFLRIKA